MSLTRWYIIRDINPVPWRVGPIGFGRGGGGRIKGYVGVDAELRTYQKAVQEALQSQSPVLQEGDLEVSMWFWRTIDEYRTETKRKARANHADGSNLFKATEDACQKVLFDNDRFNVTGHWYVVEQGPKAPARVVISVTTRGVDPESLLPDEIYASIHGREGHQLALALDAPRTELQKENDKYGNSESDF